MAALMSLILQTVLVAVISASFSGDQEHIDGDLRQIDEDLSVDSCQAASSDIQSHPYASCPEKRYIKVNTNNRKKSAYTPPCPTLKKISIDLWNKDQGKRLEGGDLIIDRKASGRDARLFKNVNQKKIAANTFTEFGKLLTTYHPNTWKKSSFTPKEEKMNNAFLDTILATSVMSTLKDYLICEGKVTDLNDFKKKLAQAWFGFVNSVEGRFGFKHVMNGDFDTKTFTGLHNWFSIYLKETNKQINEYTFVKTPQTGVITAGFQFMNHEKADGSTFILGVSPEFDIAIYSLCYFMKPDAECIVYLRGRDLKIKTRVEHDHIKSAYVIASCDSH